MKNYLIRLFVKKENRHSARPRETYCRQAFSGHLKADEKLVRDVFARCDDVIYRKLQVPELGSRQALVVLVGHLANNDVINRDIIARLMRPAAGKNTNVECLTFPPWRHFAWERWGIIFTAVPGGR